MPDQEIELEKIHDLATRERVALKKHTVLRMCQRGILIDEVKYALCSCELIERYPADRPLPNALLLGFTQVGRPIHAVAAINIREDMLWVITVYEPTLQEWRDGYRERKAGDEVRPV